MYSFAFITCQSDLSVWVTASTITGFGFFSFTSLISSKISYGFEVTSVGFKLVITLYSGV